MRKTILRLLLLVQPIFCKPIWQAIRSHHETRPSLQKLKPTPHHYGYSELDYGRNHPLERRRLEDAEDFRDKETLDYDSMDVFDVMRIKFMIEPLVALRGQSAEVDLKIKTILNKVLPEVKETWISHLSVVPVQGVIPIQTEDCFGIYHDLIPESIMQNGVDDADLAVFVSGMDTLTTSSGDSFDVCEGGTLAVATSCVLDQFDRPIVGFINFCLEALSRRALLLLDEEEVGYGYPKVQLSDAIVQESIERLDGEGAIANAQLIAIHEVGHVLGVDSDLFIFFRDVDTGEPRTARPFQEKDVVCVDGTRETMFFADSNTLLPEVSSQGRRYYDLVTPRVQTVVRNHFNCQSLPGARLENQPTGATCTGAHFDERLFYSELMGPLFSGTTDVLSPLTLALLDDSGWYKVFYEGSEVSPFGHGAGCSFVNDDCIVDDEVPWYAEGAFCSQVTQVTRGGISASENNLLCDPTHRAIGVCDLFDRDALLSSTDGGFQFDSDGIRYFSDTSLQALTAQNDWCPVASIPTGVDCTDATGELLDISYVGEEYGPNSRCINFESDVSGRAVAGCFNLECNTTSRRVVVNGTSCNFDGQRIAVPTVSGFGTSNMICPKLAVVCPHFFCQGGCSGRGICNFETNECECFDARDTTPICSGGFDGIQDPFSLSPTSVPSPPSDATTICFPWVALLLSLLVKAAIR